MPSGHQEASFAGGPGPTKNLEGLSGAKATVAAESQIKAEAGLAPGAEEQPGPADTNVKEAERASDSETEPGFEVPVSLTHEQLPDPEEGRDLVVLLGQDSPLATPEVARDEAPKRPSGWRLAEASKSPEGSKEAKPLAHEISGNLAVDTAPDVVVASPPPEAASLEQAIQPSDTAPQAEGPEPSDAVMEEAVLPVEQTEVCRAAQKLRETAAQPPLPGGGPQEETLVLGIEPATSVPQNSQPQEARDIAAPQNADVSASNISHAPEERPSEQLPVEAGEAQAKAEEGDARTEPQASALPRQQGMLVTRESMLWTFSFQGDVTQ